MVRIETSGERNAPIYVAVRETPRGGVARTVDVIPAELMIDLDKAGALIGIEILVPSHLARVPRLLRKYGVPPNTLITLLARATRSPSQRPKRAARPRPAGARAIAK